MKFNLGIFIISLGRDIYDLVHQYVDEDMYCEKMVRL